MSRSAQLLALLATARRHWGLRTWAMAGLLMVAAAAAEGTLPAFKLFVAAPGPYLVSFEDLVAAGLEEEALPSAGLGITNDGHPVPVWVEDGGDGVFGPGDRLELLGEPPHGWVSTLDEHTRYNVYFLRFDDDDPLRMTAHAPVPAAPAEADQDHALLRDRHWERDFLLQRIPPPGKGRPDERWYWAKLTHQAAEPLIHNLDLSDLAPGTVELRIELRGWSQPANKPDPEMADHRIEVTLNGTEIGSAEWNGKGSYLLRIPDVAADRFVRGDNDLALRIPKRSAGADGPLIDVVMLNWIEATYTPTPGGTEDFRLADPLAPRAMRLLANPGIEFVLYGRNGSRTTSGAIAGRPFHPPAGESSFVIVGAGGSKSPEAIVRERPSRLRDSENRADYVMIAHRRLLAAIQPLAALHRSRGLEVEVVDLQDVYDEFAGGLARPWALRDFLEHAYHLWRKPAPRFVLLVGDAAWTGKDVTISDGSFPDHVRTAATPATGRPAREAAAVDLKYTPYDEETDLVNRHLVPTWSHVTYVGYAAGDNHFVALAGDDRLPDMAIGRLPVVEPSDVANIVDKTIRYVSDPEVGPWRRNIVFLTNTLARFHRQSRRVAGFANAAGFKVLEVYSSLEEPDNEKYTRRMIESLNQGQLFVHYLGHGGRNVWETGRRDLKENRDLFTFEHLEALTPTRRLPVILSLTCYTAPFDHPEADSLGEKFLRIADRGAIAVFAASQSNAPNGTWGRILLEELTAKGATIGEAVMRAKHRVPDPLFVDTYNLLGDPAVPVALPAAEIALSFSGGEDRPLAVRGTVDAGTFSGEVMVEVVDEDFEILRSTTSRLEGLELAVDFELTAAEIAGARVVRAYAWDVSRGIDAAGAVELVASGSGEPRRPPPPVRKLTRKIGEDDEPAVAASAVEILADAVAWWSFEEAGSRAAGDRLAAHHGSLSGRASRASGPRGGALAFHGRGFVDAGSDPRLDLGTGDFTLHAWIATRQARDHVWVILDKRAGAGYHLFNYRGHLGLQLTDGKFTNYQGPFIADGRWHHVAVSVDRDRSDGIRWFVDGRETGPRQDPAAHAGSLDNPSPLYLGGRRHGGGNFVGDLDEVGIFRRALNVREVEQLYRAGWDWLDAAAGQK